MRADPGETVGVVGANGSGKTTVLRVIAGTLSADAGSVAVCDAPPGHGASAFVPAGDRGLYWRLSVAENLRFFAKVGADPGGWRERIASVADALGIEDLMGVRVEACSMGQRRRLMIARAVVAAAPVLLVDEPFEGLDETGVRQVRDLLAGWTSSGGVVVWAAPAPDHGPAAASIIGLEAT